MGVFARLNNYSKIINSNCGSTYLYFKNIKLIKPLRLLHIKKWFIFYLFKISPHFL